MSPSVRTLPLIYLETLVYLGTDVLSLSIPTCCHISIMSSKKSTEKIKPHAHTHYIVINAMLTFCYSIISHVTILLYYHAFILTLQTIF